MANQIWHRQFRRGDGQFLPQKITVVTQANNLSDGVTSFLFLLFSIFCGLERHGCDCGAASGGEICVQE